MGASHEVLAQPSPSPKYSSSLAVLGEALQDCHAPPPPPRRRADGTLPRHFAGSESGDRHQAERVLELRGVVVSVLDRSDHGDVRLLQPRSLERFRLAIYKGM